MSKSPRINRQERCMECLLMNSISKSLIFITQGQIRSKPKQDAARRRCTLLVWLRPPSWNVRLSYATGEGSNIFTIAWNALEGLVAVVAGAIAGSISLVGFGIDSFIEVTSGSVLLWRMSVDS